MWPSLPVTNHIADLANIFFIGSLVVGVVSTVLIVWMANVKEGHWERARQDSEERIASLTTQGEEAKATLGWHRPISPRQTRKSRKPTPALRQRKSD